MMNVRKALSAMEDRKRALPLRVVLYRYNSSILQLSDDEIRGLTHSSYQARGRSFFPFQHELFLHGPPLSLASHRTTQKYLNHQLSLECGDLEFHFPGIQDKDRWTGFTTVQSVPTASKSRVACWRNASPRLCSVTARTNLLLLEGIQVLLRTCTQQVGDDTGNE